MTIKSKEKLSRIEQLTIKGDYTKTRKLVDGLSSHFERILLMEEL